MAARRRVSRRRVSRRRRTTRKRRVSRKRRTIKKRVTKKRRKARKPVKKEFGTMKSVWEGKAKKTKGPKPVTKRGLMMKDGKIVAKNSVIGSRVQVFRGSKERTAGGLTKKDLMKNKHGRVVSKKAFARGRKLAKNNGISKWANAVMKARKELGVTGFFAVKKGTKLYTLARKYYDN